MSRILGKKGEEIAANYLIKRGYQILWQNYQSGHLEIDIIALRKNILSFVEVKYYKYTNQNIYYALSKKKKIFLTRAARVFLAKNPEYRDHYCRFDAIFITYYHSGQVADIVFADDLFRAE